MEGTQFDTLSKWLASTPLTRATALRGLAAGAVAGLTGLSLTADDAGAARKKSKKVQICHRGDDPTILGTTKKVTKESKKKHLRKHAADYTGKCTAARMVPGPGSGPGPGPGPAPGPGQHRGGAGAATAPSPPTARSASTAPSRTAPASLSAVERSASPAGVRVDKPATMRMMFAATSATTSGATPQREQARKISACSPSPTSISFARPAQTAHPAPASTSGSRRSACCRAAPGSATTRPPAPGPFDGASCVGNLCLF